MSFTVSYTYEVIDKATAALNKIGKGIGGLTSQANKLTGGFNKLNTSIVEVIAQAYLFRGVANSLASPIKAAISFESALSKVKKTAGLNAQETAKLGVEIQKLATRVPYAQEELAALAAVGGQLGIPKEQLAAFALESTKIAVAFDMIPEEAGNAMAVLSKSMNKPLEKMGEVMDAINFMADSGVASEKQLIEMMLSGGAALVSSLGLTHNQALALGNTFIETGISAAESGTLMEVLVRNLKDTTKVTKVLKGVDGFANFSQFLKVNPQAALEKLFSAVKSGRIPMAKLIDLIGLHAVKFEKLSKNYNIYEDSLKRANDITQQAGGVQKQFETKVETTEAQLELLSSALYNIKINIGSALLPALNSMIKALMPTIEAVSNFAQEHPTLIKYIWMAVAAITAMTAAILMAKAAAILFSGPIGIIVTAIGAGIALGVFLGDIIGNLVYDIYNGISGAFSGAFQWVIAQARAFASNLGSIITAPIDYIKSMFGSEVAINAGSAMPAAAAPVAPIGARVSGGVSVMIKNQTENNVNAYPTPNFGNMGINQVLVTQ